MPVERLTHRDAVLIAVELMAANYPRFARHVAETPNVLVGFEVAVENYEADVIRAGAIAMVQRVRIDGGSYAPGGPDLAAYCDVVIAERHKVVLAAEAEIAAQKARAAEEAHQAEVSKTTPEAAAERKARLDKFLHRQQDAQGPTLTIKETERRKNAEVRRLRDESA